jgi:energy-coupling factor transporter ATP-binding protein EcfA2
MIGKVSMFSGHSGVGKSTLVNYGTFLHLKTKQFLKPVSKASIQRLLLKCMICLLMLGLLIRQVLKVLEW